MTYTDEEIEAFCKEILAGTAAAARAKLFSSVSKKFPWTEAQRLRGIYDRISEKIPTTAADSEAKKAEAAKPAKERAIPDELKLPTPE